MLQENYYQSNLYYSEVLKQNFTSQVKFTQRWKKPHRWRPNNISLRLANIPLISLGMPLNISWGTDPLHLQTWPQKSNYFFISSIWNLNAYFNSEFTPSEALSMTKPQLRHAAEPPLSTATMYQQPVGGRCSDHSISFHSRLTSTNYIYPNPSLWYANPQWLFTG